MEDLDRFIDALEKTGAFQSVLSRQEEAQEDGTLRSIIQGYYNGRRRAGGRTGGRPGAAGAGRRRLPQPAARTEGAR